jgi:hypothetical protein
MCNLTGTLPKSCGTNPQGVTEIILLNRLDVLSVGTMNADTQTITVAISLVATKKGYAIQFTEETAEAHDSLAGDVDANHIMQQLLFSVAGQKSVLVARVQQMVGGRFLALVRFANGDVRLFGTLAAPLRLKKAEGKSGKYGSNDMRGYAFELSCSAAIFPPYYPFAYDDIADRNFI